MRRFKILGVALVAMFTLGIMATSASALPDISMALGESFPLHLLLNDNKKTPSTLQSTAGRKLEGKGLLILVTITKLSSEGTYEALFLNVKEGEENCNSPSDKTGEVLTTGKFHVVPAKKGSETLEALFETNEVEVICGTTKIKVKGTAVSSLTAGTGQITKIEGELKGKNGKNELTSYDNDEGKQVEKVFLESNFGNGPFQSDETIGEVVKLEATGQMFEITGRTGA